MNKKNIENIYPLSPTQQGILFHTLYAPESGVYVVQSCYTFSKSLNIAAFKQAWQQVINQHPILRTSFYWKQHKEPFQVVNRNIELPWQQQDWQAFPVSEQQEQLEAFLQVDRQQGFDVSQAPLMRLTLIQIAQATYHFIWSSHHLILDGWSGALVLQQVFQAYEALCHGQVVALPRSRPYADYIAWLTQQDLTKAEAFWHKVLQGFTAPTQLRVSGSANTATGYDEQSLKLSPATTAALQSLARQHKLTVNTLVQGAWAILLSRYSGEEDVVFGATSAGRPPALVGSDAMVGLFINTLPVRVQVSGDELLIPWLQKLQAQQVEAQQYEYSPLVQVQGWSEVPRDLPLFESILVFENYPVDASLKAWATEMQIHNVRSVETTNYPITIKAGVGTELALEIVSDGETPSIADRSRFDTVTITRMLGHLQTLLEGMVAHPHQSLSALPLLTAAEIHQQLIEWNNTQTHYPKHKCIHQLFEEQVEKTPDAVAVVFAEQQLTYQELNQRANQLAHYLRKLNIKAEVPVAICLERSLEMVIAILAILKVGGAYVPLDPTYPSERLAWMLEDIQTPVLLTQNKLLTKLFQFSVKVICLDQEEDTISQESNINLLTEITPQNLAYMMYTSGSTGTPKGVSIIHQGVVRLVKETTYANLNAQEVFLQAAPISFDAATFEIWGSLLNGGKLVLFPGDSTNLLADLGKVLQQYQVSTLWLTASLFHLIVDEQLEDLKQVRQLLAGGDVLSVTHVQKFLKAYSDCQLINGYGPTENTTFTCCYPITADSQIENSVPIGRPIANTQIYILDNNLQLVPVGIPGELYIGGDGLARHYYNRPDLTASKFIPNPYSKIPDSYLYKTGDLVCYLEDGNIEFLGRIDQQVKIRGFRIELGEIEAVISQHPAVRQAVVNIQQDNSGNKFLVAYFVPKTASTITVSDLRCFLQNQLPEYMLPTGFVPLETLPLNTNGKVNRKLLPVFAASHSKLEKVYVAPRNIQEEQLTQIWAEVLGLERVGIYDDFFELGGHSLLIMRLFARIRQVFQVDLPLQTLFDAPTVATLIERLETVNIHHPTFNFKADAVLDPAINCESKKIEEITNPACIFLTGATGFLGAFLLDELLQQTQADIYCLVRAANAEEGKQKLRRALESYFIWNESQSYRIIPVVGDLSQPLLGLSQLQFTAIAKKIDVIYHNGAWVHHASPYSTLKAANVLGTQEVLRLASEIKIKPVHFISTISVFSPTTGTGVKLVSEESHLDDYPIPEGGYTQSKWVAEKLINIARDRGLPISIYRPGRISGHSKTGAFNPNDFFYRLLIGCVQLGSVPKQEFFDSLAPVDYVSKAIVYLSRQKESLNNTFHVLNPQLLNLKILFNVVRSFGYPLQQLSEEQWQKELIKIADNFPDHPLYPLIPLFTLTKSSESASIPENSNFVALEFDCSNTQRGLIDTSIVCPTTDEKLLATYFSHLVRHNFVSVPNATEIYAKNNF
ncbi:amino acid adenylation domain protein [Tolypothrix tenuis PCC 7101]|uniref:Amino acid adenylation domain protein n=1 Tax=Tolypothrix tenuis PCC 7101 TaxID=231146 RepID=A0A1Z4N1J7_9CYAN|nr:amino acid adenylation domain-containing protein [Aulosira sp. FACHB-113]BAY99584.1 amino acid adenylation domain protein [Tolypothrix tenuis PCC 7101]BAZ76494.1 amino acid adenylation domain protein [Aulosira laxa NIES-50]